MDALLLPLALLSALGLAAVALSFLAILQARYSTRMLDRRVGVREAQLEAGCEAAQETVRSLAMQIREIQEHFPAAPVAALPRPGLNLSTRSQALRMYRRGDNPAQIAAVLQIPAQEVELLLKVHRLVLHTLTASSKAVAAPERIESP